MINAYGKIKKIRKNPYNSVHFIKKSAVTANEEIYNKEIYSIDQEVIDKETTNDRFYVVCMDLKGDLTEIIAINKHR